MVISTILSVADELLHVVVEQGQLLWRLRSHLFLGLNSDGATGFGID